MDPYRQPENPSGPNRRGIQIQGPRPSPLSVNKDSHKITKKPPIHPKPTIILHNQQQQQQEKGQQPLLATGNQPVIIYSVSPKPIYVEPSDFRSIVQALTGNQSENPFPGGELPVSPAARFASIERTSPSGRERREKVEDDAFFKMMMMNNNNNNDDLGINNNSNNNNSFNNNNVNVVDMGQNPGILSPSPANLPAISSGMFSPVENSMENQLGLGFGGIGNELIMSPFMSNLSFLPSPSSMFLSTPLVSPSPSSLSDFFKLFD